MMPPPHAIASMLLAITTTSDSRAELRRRSATISI
jgi:hypothetical protein